MADAYEERSGRAAFWAVVAAAVSPPEFAADDVTRNAPKDVGSYSVRGALPSTGFTSTVFSPAERL